MSFGFNKTLVHGRVKRRYSKRMSLEQIEASILDLSAAERRRFAAWFEAHRGDLLTELQQDDRVRGRARGRGFAPS
jgi:hypothetical protein